jgi:hypothetical protein
MKKIVPLVLLIIPLSMQSYGQYDDKPLRVQQVIMALQATNENFHSVDLFNSPEENYIKGMGSYVHYTIDKSELRKTFYSNFKSIRLSLPLADGTIKNLLLTQHTVITDNFKLTIGSEKEKHDVKYQPGLYYYGMVEGYTHRSMVVCSIFENELNCMISDETGNWNMVPLKAKDNSQEKDENEYAYYNNKSLHLPLKFTCESPEGIPIKSMGISQRETSSSAANCVRVYFDCDYDTYKAFGNSPVSVANYVISMFNEISTLYVNEYISVAISEIHVWDHQDPYKIPTKEAELSLFKDNNSSFNGDIAHLIRYGGDFSAGIAYLSGLCNGKGYGVDIIYFSYTASELNFPTYTRDAEVVTHEMGHNFGSPHTHECVWNGNDTKIDQCGDAVGDNCCSCNVGVGLDPLPANGTIMSYCDGGIQGAGINFIYGFGPQPGKVIRDGVAGADCLSNCTFDCLPVISVGNAITPGNYVQFYASRIVYGSSTVESGAIAFFSGGDSVILRNGFYAQAGSSFIAQNAPCPSSFNAKTINNNSNLAGERNDIKISPNPFNSTFVLSINSKQNVKAGVVIYNSIGAKIKEKHGINILKGLNTIDFNLSRYAKGVYLVQINIGSIKTIKKLVKM